MPSSQDLSQTPETQRVAALQRMKAQEQILLQRHVRNSKALLQRLRPEAAVRFFRSLRPRSGDATPADSQTSSPEQSISSSSSSTIIPKHLGPSDSSSNTSTATVARDATPTEGSLKRKRTDDEEELDEVAERVKRLKVHRKSLWESFDDSQFNMNSGLLYDPKLWEWYW